MIFDLFRRLYIWLLEQELEALPEIKEKAQLGWIAACRAKRWTDAARWRSRLEYCDVRRDQVLAALRTLRKDARQA